MACCLTAPSHYLNPCWLSICEVLWHSHEGNFTGNTQYIYSPYEFENYTNLRLLPCLPGATELNPSGASPVCIWNPKHMVLRLQQAKCWQTIQKWLLYSKSLTDYDFLYVSTDWARLEMAQKISPILMALSWLNHMRKCLSLYLSMTGLCPECDWWQCYQATMYHIKYVHNLVMPCFELDISYFVVHANEFFYQYSSRFFRWHLTCAKEVTKG